MKLPGVILMGLALAGCASQNPGVSNPPHVMTDSAYSPTAAVALAFDPPVLAGTPRLDLSRDDRGPTAFAGFSDTTTTFFYLRTDDWYSDYGAQFSGPGTGNRENLQRRAVTETIGVSHH